VNRNKLTITYPATKETSGQRVNVTSVVQWTGEIKDFSEIPDGGLFLIGSKVYEKLGTQNISAQLLPWDDEDFYDFKPTVPVGVLMTIKPEKF